MPDYSPLILDFYSQNNLVGSADVKLEAAEEFSENEHANPEDFRSSLVLPSDSIPPIPQNYQNMSNYINFLNYRNYQNVNGLSSAHESFQVNPLATPLSQNFQNLPKLAQSLNSSNSLKKVQKVNKSQMKVENPKRPKIKKVAKKNSLPKHPFLQIEINGKEYWSNFRKCYNGALTMYFGCPKADFYDCPFEVKVRAVKTKNHKEAVFWNVSNWRVIEILQAHTCHTIEESFEITDIIRCSPDSKHANLVISQNGLDYRCTYSNLQNTLNGQLFRYRCSKQNSKSCYFGMYVQPLITRDYLDENFWSVENWKISEFTKPHTCEPDNSSKELPFIVEVTRSGSSYNPSITINENGLVYKCAKNSIFKGHFRFVCSRARTTGCNFKMKVKTLLTDDPNELDFWNNENWEIFEVVRSHSCMALEDTLNPKMVESSPQN